MNCLWYQTKLFRNITIFQGEKFPTIREWVGIIGNGSGNNAKDPEAFARDPCRITDVTTSNRRFVRCIYYTIPGCLRMSSGKHVAITGSVCINILKKNTRTIENKRRITPEWFKRSYPYYFRYSYKNWNLAVSGSFCDVFTKSQKGLFGGIPKWFRRAFFVFSGISL